MPLLHRQPPRRQGLARALVTILGGAVLFGLLPVASAGAASPRGADELQPTIHYEDALAHAKDKIAFEPGGRVTVPFRPRQGDHWKVGGTAPRTLPAGRATGRAMRAADGAAMDAPLIDPAARVATIDASVTEPAAAPEIDLAAAVDPGALRREVFGFLPYWELSDSSTRLDWEKISTVAYFGVGAAANGSLQKRNSDGSTTVGWSGWTSAKMTSVINAAHTSGARVVLTVQSFAWSSGGATRQKALLGSATARANLASQIATAVRDRGADGVNLDFEPIVSGYADEFTALVRKVRAALDAKAKGYQLTFDTTGYIGNYPIGDATAAGGADAIMIMGYDYRTSGSSFAGSIAPLHASSYDITDTVAAYLARVPASKLILGVPYYGRAWSTDSDQFHADNISGTKYGASSTSVYSSAREFLVDHGRRYDATEAVAWTAYKRQTCTTTYGCVTSWRQLYVDDATALKAKYDLVNAKNLRGVGIWALGYDGTRTELYAALKDKFITDTVPPAITGSALTTAAFSPNGDGVRDTTTASLTATALVRWGYRVQPVVSGVAGDAIRSGSKTGKSPSFTWDGTDKDGVRAPDGTYRITLWAADASDNRSERAFTVTLDTRPPGITPKAEDQIFSPDGNGYDDTLSMAWTSTQAIDGTARIFDGSGTKRSWSYTGKTSWSTEWDGKTSAGTRVPNGHYTYRVNGHDAAGNPRIVDLSILVDDTIRLHKWSDYRFDPRAGQTSRMTVTLRRHATVTAAIYLGTTKIRSIWTGKAFAAGTYGWTWNGRTGSGSYAKPGTYRVVVRATSTYGTTSWSKTVAILVH